MDCSKHIIHILCFTPIANFIFGLHNILYNRMLLVSTNDYTKADARDILSAVFCHSYITIYFHHSNVAIFELLI